MPIEPIVPGRLYIRIADQIGLLIATRELRPANHLTANKNHPRNSGAPEHFFGTCIGVSRKRPNNFKATSLKTPLWPFKPSHEPVRLVLTSARSRCSR